MKYNFQKQHILFIILLIVGIVFLIQCIPKAFFTDTVVEDESPLFTEPLRGELNQSMEFPDGSKNSFNISYNFTTKFAYAPGNPIFFQFLLDFLKVLELLLVFYIYPKQPHISSSLIQEV